MGNTPGLQSRRTVIKRILQAGVYVAPAVLTVSQVSQAAAVTLPLSSVGGNMSVGFSFLSDAGGGYGDYLVRGAGFASNMPFFLVIAPFNSNGGTLLFDQRAVFTDQGGTFAYQTQFVLGISSQPITALVNGGIIFLTAVPNFSTVPTATPNATGTAVAATATAIALTGTPPIPIAPTRSSGPDLTGTATAAAKTAVAATSNLAATAVVMTQQAAATQAASAATKVAQTVAAHPATVAANPPVVPQPSTHH